MYVTDEGLEKIKKELNDLQNILPSLIKETGAMAALGDRSENAGYINAKQQMRKTQGRIRYLEDLIKNAKLIMTPNNSESIQIGSNVVLKNLSTKELEKYRIVDSLEADPSKKLISFHSPIGKMLLGKTINEQIILETPYFKTEYTIVEIK